MPWQLKCAALYARLSDGGTNTSSLYSFPSRGVYYYRTTSSIGDHNHDLHLLLEADTSDTYSPCDEERHANNAATSAEKHHVQVFSVVATDQSASDGTSSQSTNRTGSEDSAHSNPDLSDWRDLCNQRRRETDRCTGTKSENQREHDLSGVACTRNPESQHEDDGESAEDNHDVEASDLVAEKTWERSTEH